MGYSAAKVSTHIELEKNRGYWRAKGLIVIVVSCHYRAVKKIERTRGHWRFYGENHKQVKAEPILYTL
ncbi:creatininase [Escherichia coli]|nr:creatininase [Escherichia coli]